MVLALPHSKGPVFSKFPNQFTHPREISLPITFPWITIRFGADMKYEAQISL